MCTAMIMAVLNAGGKMIGVIVKVKTGILIGKYMTMVRIIPYIVMTIHATTACITTMVNTIVIHLQKIVMMKKNILSVNIVMMMVTVMFTMKVKIGMLTKDLMVIGMFVTMMKNIPIAMEMTDMKNGGSTMKQNVMVTTVMKFITIVMVISVILAIMTMKPMKCGVKANFII